ncbi:uncharacterized protein LOC126160167 [Schistocerca cancellata]|uniref:uncharacterized protein LOC126160167 n=1 Tax=Schistocerca cancellata TaxID=274614 RepID=UPI002119A244|nr:uncharacterized protein LOC126160167 [Schistocerca cancellata]
MSWVSPKEDYDGSTTESEAAVRCRQAITPESIVLLVTEEDLDELCGQVRDSLDALARVAASCAALGDDDRDVYQALLRGVATLHADLCAPSQPAGLRASFLQHSACLRNLSQQLQECAGPRDWTESEDERAVCATYERIATCYHSATAVACGSEAADLMRQLVVSVASSVLGECKGKLAHTELS